MNSLKGMDSLFVLFLNNNQFRKEKTIRNILKGKKTVANLYIAKKYNLINVIGLSKYINDFKVDESLLDRDNEERIKLNDDGQLVKEKIISMTNFNFIQNNFYYDIYEFKRRFILILQIMSEFFNHNKKYIPIENQNYRRFYVKKWFHNLNQKKEAAIELKNILNEFLTSILPIEAEIIAKTFVGFKRHGETITQIAEEKRLSYSIIQIIEFNAYCQLINFFKKSKNYSIITKDLEKNIVNKNALKTFSLLDNNYSFEEVMKIMNSKKSTIEEHILELAIFDLLSKKIINKYFNVNLYDRLKKEDNLIYNLTYSKLNFKCSFFEFRFCQILSLKGNN